MPLTDIIYGPYAPVRAGLRSVRSHMLDGSLLSGMYGLASDAVRQYPELGPVLSSAPVVGDLLRGYEQSDQLRGYLAQNGMTMSDVAYPFSATQQFLPAYGAAFGYVGALRGKAKKKRRRKGKKVRRIGRYHYYVRRY